MAIVKLERVGDHHRTHLGVFDTAAFKVKIGKPVVEMDFDAYCKHLDEAHGEGEQRRFHLEVTELEAKEWNPAWGDEKHPCHPANRKK